VADELVAKEIKGLAAPLPPLKLADYPDGKVPGLSVRVFSSGRRSWYLKYRQDGRQRRYKLGDFPALGLARARREAEKMRVAVRDGADPVRERLQRQADSTDNTFGALIRSYFEYHDSLPKRADDYLDPTTRVEYRRILFGGPKIDDVKPLRSLPVSEITHQDIARALTPISGRGRGRMRTSTKQRLSGVFTWAIEQGLLDSGHNPVSEVRSRKGSQKKPRDRALDKSENRGEIAALWHEIDRRKSIASLALRVLLATGQRPGEIARMEWAHIEGNRWRMPKGYRKLVRGQRIAPEHDVPLSDLALVILTEVKQRHRAVRTKGRQRWVFPNPNTKEGHVSRDAIRQAADRINTVIGLEPWTPHDLRRTVRTHLAKLRVPREVARKVTGHVEKDIVDETYDVYDYWDERVEALDKWAARLTELISR
jgi:integrase